MEGVNQDSLLGAVLNLQRQSRYHTPQAGAALSAGKLKPSTEKGAGNH